MKSAKRTLTIVAITALVGCSSPKVPAATSTLDMVTLHVHATTATYPLLLDLSNQNTFPAFTFDTETGNYHTMIDRLISGDAPYFFSNHLPADSTLWAAPVAQDGIAIIVHPDNTIDGLTIDQLRHIYQGRVSNWHDCGGAEGNIIILSRENGSGTRAEFERLVMGERRTTPGAQLAPSSAAMVVSVASLPGSIGYVSVSYVDSSVHPLMVDGIAPTLDNVAGNLYPLRSTVFVVGKDEPRDEYRLFIGWVQGIDGQAIVARRYAPLFNMP